MREIMFKLKCNVPPFICHRKSCHNCIIALAKLIVGECTMSRKSKGEKEPHCWAHHGMQQDLFGNNACKNCPVAWDCQMETERRAAKKKPFTLPPPIINIKDEIGNARQRPSSDQDT